MNDIWEVLRIERTSDQIAIKKAYAARLRSTRPDEDPSGYQALREAYEFALMQAAWMPEQGALPADWAPSGASQPQAANTETPEGVGERAARSLRDSTEAPHASMGAADAVADIDGAEEQPREWTTPEILAAQLESTLRNDGEKAALAAWPELERALNALPLALHVDASWRFADLIIYNEALPSVLVVRLDRYFEWQKDFRASQLLGLQRMQALLARLSRTHAFAPSPAFAQHYGPVTDFSERTERMGRWAFAMQALLAGSRLRQLWRELDTRERVALGVTQEQDARIDLAFGWSAVLRIAVIAAIATSYFGYERAIGRSSWLLQFGAVVGLSTVVWVIGTAMLARLGDMRRGFYDGFLKGTATWKGVAVHNLLGLGCLAAAFACALIFDGDVAAVAKPSPLFGAAATLLCALAGILIYWPRQPAQTALPWMFWMSGLVGAGLVGQWAGFVAGLLWLALNLFGHMHLRPSLNALAQEAAGLGSLVQAAARVSVCWPATVLAFVVNVSALPAIAAIGVAIVAVGPDHSSLRLLAWVVCTFALYGLDTIFARCGEAIGRTDADRRAGWLALVAMLASLGWVLVYASAGPSINEWILENLGGSAGFRQLLPIFISLIGPIAGITLVRRTGRADYG